MHDTRPAGGPLPARRSWTRRALFGLWVVGFIVAGAELASRWDSLMSHLAGPRAASQDSGGSSR
jgi:hypothetical protein